MVLKKFVNIKPNTQDGFFPTGFLLGSKFDIKSLELLEFLCQLC